MRLSIMRIYDGTKKNENFSPGSEQDSSWKAAFQGEKKIYSTLFEVYFKDNNNCMCIKNTFLVPKRLNIKTRDIL